MVITLAVGTKFTYRPFTLYFYEYTLRVYSYHIGE